MVQVSTKAQLLAELEAASPAGGVTIELVAGTYAELRLNVNGAEPWAAYDLPVVIKSLDTENQAVLTEALRLKFVQNLRFEHITFLQMQEPPSATFHQPFGIEDCQDIYFWRCNFDGNVALSVSRVGYGLHIYRCTRVTVNECEVVDFNYGVGIYETCLDIKVVNGTIRQNREDFIQAAGPLDTILIEGNEFKDSRIDGEAHADMIQFFGGPFHNVTIRGNILTPGDGEWTQTIFMTSNDGQSTNITIEENVIHNGDEKGIFCPNGADNVTVRNNTLLRALYSFSLNPAPAVYVPVTVTNATIENNIEPSYLGINVSSLEVEYDDTEHAQYVETLFVNPLNATNIVPLSDFRAVTSGLIETEGWGAEMTRTGIRHQWVEEGGSPPPDPPPPGLSMQFWQVWPQMLHRPENILPQQGLKTLTGVGDKVSWVIPAPFPMEVSHFALQIGTAVGSPTVTCSVHAVNPTTGELGSLWAANTEGTSGALSSGASPIIAAGATASIARGQVVAFTVTLASGTSAVIASPAGLVQLVGGMPYVLDDGVTKSNFVASGMAVGSSATEWYSLPGFFPFTSIPNAASAAYNNASAITRKGVRLIPKFTAYLIGARLPHSLSHNGNFELRTYDSLGTTLIGPATVVNGTFKQNVHRFFDIHLTTPENLLLIAGTEYLFLQVPNSTTDCYFTWLNLASANFFSAHQGDNFRAVQYDGANYIDLNAVPALELFWGRPL